MSAVTEAASVPLAEDILAQALAIDWEPIEADLAQRYPSPFPKLD